MSANTPSTSPSGLLALSIVVPSICAAVVALRFELRRQKSPIKADDWMMLPALMLFIGMCICAILGVKRRVWGYATPPRAERRLNPAAYQADSKYEAQLFEAFQFLQIPALGLIKIGALLFFHRIFCVRTRRTGFNTLLHVLIGITILWILALFTMNGLQCGTRLSALWSTSNAIYVQYCIYVIPFEKGFVISNFLLDFFILITPIPKIWALQMPIGRRFAIMGVFGLAFVGFAGSIARMVQYLRLAANDPTVILDFRLEDTESIFWSNLEAGLSLVAVNLPSLWAYINKSSPEGIVASLRSMLSLRSLRSGGSSNPSRSHMRIADNERMPSSNVLLAKIIPDQDSTGSYNMDEITGPEVSASSRRDAFTIKKNFMRSSTIVQG